MLAKLAASRVLARAAVAGSALGLVTLAALVIWSTATTYRATTRVRAMDQVSQTWSDIFQQVSLEEDAAREYAVATDDDARLPLTTVLGSAEPPLKWLVEHETDRSRENALLVQQNYRGFTDSLREMVAEGGTASPEVISLQANAAQLAAAALRKQITANIDGTQFQKSLFLDQVDRNTARLRIAGALIFALDLVLLVLCSLVLLAYQRRIERESATNKRQAMHDTLTGLGNRVLLRERMSQAIRDADLHHDEVALLLIDLDGFKEVNDTLGHHAGDLLLQQVAEHLCGVVRDIDTVVRLGGDEFAILLPGLKTQDNAHAVASRALTALRQPVEVNGLTLEVGGSIGVALYPSHSADAEQLLQHADIAMYSAKRGRLGVVGYEPPQAGENGTPHLTLLGELRRALRDNEIVLHYQPKATGKTRQVKGVEALARWQHPERGLLGPAEFIPAAERNGFMGELTEYVLRAALQQCHRWQESGLRVPVSVNVGAQCLQDSGFPRRVAALLMENRVSADLLTLEITESAIIPDPVRAHQVLDEIRSLGVWLSIDDFGSGYASMSYLRTLPVHELKIDRSFVSQMETDQNSRAIVRAVTDLAHSLGLQVVAEGVEDDETWLTLASLGCDSIQGYYLSRPMPTGQLDPWLSERMGEQADDAVRQ